MTFQYPFNRSYVGTKDAMSPSDSSGGVQKVFHGFPSTAFLKSNNNFSGSGQSVSKDMAYTGSRQIPYGYNPSSSSLSPSGNRFYWNDWSSDVFDGWGDWNIYNPATNTSTYLEFTYINQADGSLSTEYRTIHSRNWKITHGFVAQGVYKIEFVCLSDATFTFWFSHWGNMGSDGSTLNSNYTYSASWGTLFWNYNRQSGSSTEVFSTYCIPRVLATNQLGSWNSSIFYSGISGSDNLAIWVGPLTHGATFYYAKSSNLASSVANDIIKTTGSYF